MPAPAAQRSRRLRALHAHLRTAPAAATEAETQDITAEQRQSMIDALPTAVQRRMKNMSEEEQDALLAYMAEKKAEEALWDGPELILPTIAPDTPVPPKMMHRLNELQLLDSAREIDDIGYTIVREAIPLELVERVKGLIKHEAMEQAGLAAKGQDVDIDNETEWTGSAYIHSILYRDPAFEEVLAAPKPMALVHLLLGKSALMASMGCHFKGPGFATGEGELRKCSRSLCAFFRSLKSSAAQRCTRTTATA